jgi:sugar/nucleoside kinase (ribokinase family)
MEPPDFVVIGHLTQDLRGGGCLLGGAAYSALTAASLGRRVGLVTSFGPDMDLGALPSAVQIAAHPSPNTTVFRNLYCGPKRQQFVLSVAASLSPQAVPLAWQGAPIVLLAPVVGEVDPQVAHLFPKALRGATPQGWMRRWGPGVPVQPCPWSAAEEILPWLDGLFLSRDDLGGDEALASLWAAKVRCLVLTDGERGAWLYYGGRVEHVPARPAPVVDPTGAGDAFAAAFLVRWAEGDAPLRAAHFASWVASLVVTGDGVGGIPTAQELEGWARST